ncbi:MAG: hypothetical protein CBARDCOR_4596 [uncultured Caballeronia sp.]|nr:MAG: hypothetical protein CBARDCOR_4596 [uncultured Caballeronia sp.]
MMCLLEVMHRIIRHTVQVWYRLDAGIRILPGVRIGGAVQGHPDTTAQQKLKHKGLDLHNERTFRHIVMHFCNFSVSAKTFADGNIVRSMQPLRTLCIEIVGLYVRARRPL